MSKKPTTFKVDTIVGHRNTQGNDYYKVHWLGYSDKEDTWEPIKNLTNCLDLIKQFMDKKVAEERRKSLRDHYTLSSDDELDTTKTTRKSVSKKTPVKRTTRASVTPSKKTTKDDSIRKSYYLRSGMTEFSSEDESGLDLHTSRSTKKTRMSLSESRFKKQLANIRKDIYTSSPRKTSTPQASPSKSIDSTNSPSKVQATKKLSFDSTQHMRARAVDIPPMITRLRQRHLEEEITVSEEPPTVSQAEDSENEEVLPVKKSPKKVAISKKPVLKGLPQKRTEEEQCFPVTWREFALAAFVTGVAGLGYLCYTSDYCSFC